MIRKVASYILLVGTYCLTWLVTVVGRVIPRRRWKPNGRLLVTGTIFNPNWYLSHITPLVRSGATEVILVIDEALQPMEGVRFACPPKWLARVVSRAGAKAIWMLYAGIRYRPDLFMGYNLVAGGCTALAAGAILGRPACYQMTGGTLVLSTFYYDAFENAGRVERKVARIAERLAVAVIRCFDLIVVRGSTGKAFLTDHGITRNVAVITGSVKPVKYDSERDRSIDLIFVGRLVPVKQVDQFIAAVRGVSCAIPSVRAVIAGDGPLMEDMKMQASRLGISDRIEFLGKRSDVEALLAQSKVFVLTSKSEGMSIALAEAMAAGVVPAVADVGELSDLVIDGVNGFLVTPNQSSELSEKITRVLLDRKLWTTLSRAAVEAAQCCDVGAVAKAWQRHLQTVIAEVSGHPCGENPGSRTSEVSTPHGGSKRMPSREVM